MKNTKKALLMTLCAVMLVAASVMGTLAYLQDTSEVAKNTFTVGNVHIMLNEKDVDDDDNKADNITVNGVVRDRANSYKLIPGATYEKDPMVTVLKTSEDCYVRAFVTVTESAELDTVLPNADLTKLFTGYDSTKWTYVGNVEDTTSNTRTYEFWYANKVTDVPENADKALEPIFTGIKVPGTLTNDQLEKISGMEINVIAHAIQAEGFANAEAAWSEF